MRPHLVLQMAHSSDGYVASTGQRTPLSCEETWTRIRADRQNVDAVMIGINTALIDNPKLLSRAAKTPVRVVVDTNASLPPASHLALTARETPVWLLTAQDAPTLEHMGVRLIKCPLKNNRIDLPAALEQLYALGIKTLVCEGGATLAQTLNDERLVDELVLIESDMALGRGIGLPVLSGYRPLNEIPVGTDTWRYFEKI